MDLKIRSKMSEFEARLIEDADGVEAVDAPFIKNVQAGVYYDPDAGSGIKDLAVESNVGDWNKGTDIWAPAFFDNTRHAWFCTKNMDATTTNYTEFRVCVIRTDGSRGDWYYMGAFNPQVGYPGFQFGGFNRSYSPVAQISLSEGQVAEAGKAGGTHFTVKRLNDTGTKNLQVNVHDIR